MVKQKSFNRLFFLCAAAGALTAGTPAHAGDAGAADNAVRLRTLLQQIDSLEVEKQGKKRSGQAFDDLEELTGRLRDSVASLRRDFEQGTAAAPAPLSGREAAGKGSCLKKLCLYDRIMVAAACFFVLFAAVFFLVYFTAASRRRKQRRPAETNGRSRMESRQPGDTAAGRAYAAQIKPAGTPPLPPQEIHASFTGASAPVQPARPGGQAPGLPKDLNDLVVRAAGEGLDAKEISRRYHISEDQVALVLKMSRK